MAKLKGGQAAVETLQAQGVDTIFGIISIHTLELYDALFDHQDTFRFITTRHEGAAAHMADAYARVSGKPGVCFTSSGPGAANSVIGMGEAYTASSPLLNITSTGEEDLYGRDLGAAHDMKDQLGMLASVSGSAVHVSQAKDIPDRIYEAFERFHTQRPRPATVEIATDVLGHTAEVEIPQRHQFPRPPVDPASVERAASLLLSGKRAAILAGNGVQRSGATGEVLRLAEALGIPVITSIAGKGALPEDHPLSLGCAQSAGKPGPLKEFVESLDTLLVVGSSLARWKERPVKSLIHVDIDSDSIGRIYPTAVGVLGDAKDAVSLIAQAVGGKRAQLSPGFERDIRELKAAISRYWWEAMPNEMRVWATVREVLRRDAIFVGDVTRAINGGALQCLPVYEPRTYLTPQWYGLGFGLPAAVGAKAALPSRQVVCVTGDGGFQFNMQELGTCLQYGLNPVIVMFNDNAWGALKSRQRANYNGRFFATELRNPDWIRLAESYGANGVRAATAQELASALDAAFRADTVTLIEVPIPNGVPGFK